MCYIKNFQQSKKGSLMLKKLIKSCFIYVLFGLSVSSWAASIVAPQPVTCVTSSWSAVGDKWSKTIALTLTNACTQPVDFQNAQITFQSNAQLTTDFWGDFEPLSYPDNKPLNITSQKQTSTIYLASLSLHFPTYDNSNSVLPVKKSIIIRYVAPTDSHIGKANVYLNTGNPSATGTITVTNTSAKPSGVSPAFAIVHLTSNGTVVSNLQVPWSGSQSANSLVAGNYTLTVDNVSDSTGNSYQGTITPSTIQLASGQAVTSTLKFQKVSQPAKIAIQNQALPTEITTYSGTPNVVVTQSGGSSAATVAAKWNTSTTVNQLTDGATYTLTTPTISFNNYICTPNFSPASIVASSTQTPVINLSYACARAPQNTATLNVNGGPTSLAALKIMLTPNDSSTPLTQTISLSNGSGSSTVQLNNNVSYTVSADAVSDYVVSFNPQPLASTGSAVEQITLTAAAVNTPVGLNGQLKVCGTKLCNQQGQAIQLKGMSTHGLQWYGWGTCIDPTALDSMVKWGINVIRIAMYVQEDGYESDPNGFTQQVNTIIDEATKRGLYAIVDFHILTPGDPNANLANAKKFFTAIANAHKNNVNVLYEICNEPNGVSWAQIKSYAETIIPIIRAIDNHSPIIVGTTGWSSLGVSEGNGPQEIISNQVNATNIMYTFHFYAVSHRDDYYNAVNTASNSIPVFVTEFGEQDYTGDGANDFTYTDKYLSLFAQKQIGWTNWNWADDFRSGSIWKTGACSTKKWLDNNLKPSGTYIKAKFS
jgi:endoglucanase